MDTRVILEHEIDNQYDPSAIRVYRLIKDPNNPKKPAIKHPLGFIPAKVQKREDIVLNKLILAKMSNHYYTGAEIASIKRLDVSTVTASIIIGWQYPPEMIQQYENAYAY